MGAAIIASLAGLRAVARIIRMDAMKTGWLCTLVLTLPAVQATSLIHSYALNQSLSDLVGSIALSSDGGSVTAAGYAFGARQGLNVSSALPNTANYSLLMDFSYQALTGYRKILDFKNLVLDLG